MFAFLIALVWSGGEADTLHLRPMDAGYSNQFGSVEEYYNGSEFIYIAKLERVQSTDECENVYRLHVLLTLVGTDYSYIHVCGSEWDYQADFMRSIEIGERHQQMVDSMTPFHGHSRPICVGDSDCHVAPFFNAEATYIISRAAGGMYSTISFEPVYSRRDPLLSFLHRYAN